MAHTWSPQFAGSGMNAEPEFAKLLASWHARGPGSDEKFFACIYTGLRIFAARHMRRERPADTLQATDQTNLVAFDMSLEQLRALDAREASVRPGGIAGVATGWSFGAPAYGGKS